MPKKKITEKTSDEAIRCPKCKRPRVYGQPCPFCGDAFKAHPSVIEHLEAEKKKPAP